MHGSNTTEFILTPENYLDELIFWLPEQFEKMRLYQAGTICVKRDFSSFEIQYMHTIGGEKFRVVECTIQGDSGSCYYGPLNQDDDVILDFARRLERGFESVKKFNKIWKDKEPKPVEYKMVFTPGPFDGQIISSPEDKQSVELGGEPVVL